MINIHKKSKIIATLGPSTQTEETITSLVANGMNVARLNFSHGTQHEQEEKLKLVRKIEKEQDQPIAILQDLQGPKIRLGDLAQEPQLLTNGESIILFHGLVQKNEEIPVSTNIFPFLHEGNSVLINDGLIHLKVEKIEKEKAVCKVIIGGEILSHKGINLPDTTLPNVALTEKDKNDLLFGLDHEVDYIALSFVQSAEDIKHLRHIITNHQHHPKIVAKIETKSAVKNVEEIIQETDVVMIARGDMAVEVGQEEVPLIQRRIIRLCREYNKPVIIATQMLESMMYNPQPTRAEVSDIANAVIEQVDALMLSGETALGKYPIEAIHMMNKVIRRIEQEDTFHDGISHIRIEDAQDQTTAIAAAASLLARQLRAKMIFSLTASGKTALKLSLYRSSMPVISVTHSLLVCRELALVYGIHSFYKKTIKDNEGTYAEIIEHMMKNEALQKDDKIVMVTGTNPGEEGYTNSISVTTIV